jgi:hypothetical protein
MRWIFFTLLAVNITVLTYGVWGLSWAPVQAIAEKAVGREVVPSLVLLEEQKIGQQVVESVRLKKKVVLPNQSQASANIPISRSLCTLVGSFSEQAKAEYFVRRLASLGAKAKVKNLLVSTTVGFWLHLPPLSSRKELFLRLSELKRQGVDSYVIPDGDLANGISLGMFSEAERAKKLQDKMILLGYRPKIAEVPREKRELWVFLLQAEATKIDQERWLKLLSGKELLQKQQNLCSDVASA